MREVDLHLDPHQWGAKWPYYPKPKAKAGGSPIPLPPLYGRAGKSPEKCRLSW